jgi:hypothetical protein
MITEQVAPGQGAPQPSTAIGRWQMVVIGAVVLLAAGIGLVLGLTILSDRGSSLGASAAYVPADAVVYLEARLDLPTGQRESLRTILERFPDADPDAILGEALADTLDEGLANMRAPIDYSSDVAPWFDGRVAVTLLDYPLNTDPASMRLPATAALVGVRDATAAAAFADSLREEMAATGASFSSSEHGGVTIWTLAVDSSMTAPMEGLGFAYALTDDQLLLANGGATVEKLLDVHAGSGESLGQRDELRDLSARLPAEWVGVMTVDTGAMLEQVRVELEATSPELAEALRAYLDAVPAFMIASVGFEDDAVRFDGATTMPGGDLTPSNGTRRLAYAVPADAIFFADGPNVGPSLAKAVTGLRATLGVGAEGATVLEQLEQAEAALGADLDEFVSWIGSGAMVAGWDGEQPYGGLVLEASDPQAAAQRLGQLRALVELAAMDPSTQVDVSTESLGDVEVTTISVSVDAPAEAAMLPVSEVIVQYALEGEVAVIGFGDRFVGRVLEIAPGASLADTDRFRGAIDRFGGADNAGAFFLDLVALREAIEAAIPAPLPPEYESEVRPNLDPLDYLAGVTRVEGDAVVSRFGMVVRP